MQRINRNFRYAAWCGDLIGCACDAATGTQCGSHYLGRPTAAPQPPGLTFRERRAWRAAYCPPPCNLATRCPSLDAATA